jgi:hypothetical protein
MLLLRKALLFLLLFTAIYVAFFLVMSRITINGTPVIYRMSNVFHWKGGDAWQRFQEYDPAVRHDVVVLGSSHAYRGYDPEIFEAQGYDMFNLGSSGQTAMNTRYILEEYLHADNTGLLLVEVSKAWLEDDGLESTCELVQNLPADRAAVRMAMSIRDPRAVNILALRWAMRGREPIYLSENYVGRGYCRHHTQAPEGLEFGKGGRFDPLPEQVAHFQALLAVARARGIPMALVTHPVPHASDRGKHQAFVDYLAGELAGSGVRHIDMGLDHDLDDRLHFADHSHLNQAGVEIFVPRLLARLVAEGLLPTRAQAGGTP